MRDTIWRLRRKRAKLKLIFLVFLCHYSLASDATLSVSLFISDRLLAIVSWSFCCAHTGCLNDSNIHIVIVVIIKSLHKLAKHELLLSWGEKFFSFIFSPSRSASFAVQSIKIFNLEPIVGFVGDVLHFTLLSSLFSLFLFTLNIMKLHSYFRKIWFCEVSCRWEKRAKGKMLIQFRVSRWAVHGSGSLSRIGGENVEVNGIIKLFITVTCFLSASRSLRQPFC